jgi:hypothetical protein
MLHGSWNGVHHVSAQDGADEEGRGGDMSELSELSHQVVIKESRFVFKHDPTLAFNAF